MHLHGRSMRLYSVSEVLGWGVVRRGVVGGVACMVMLPYSALDVGGGGGR